MSVLKDTGYKNMYLFIGKQQMKLSTSLTVGSIMYALQYLYTQTEQDPTVHWGLCLPF